MFFDVHVEKMQFSDTPHAVQNPMLRKLFRLQPIKHHEVLIKDLDFVVNKGEVISMVGASGAGKTTLLRILAGLETQFIGHVKLNDDIVKKPSRKIQIVFQNNVLLPWLNVEDNIAFTLVKGSQLSQNQNVITLLNKVGLLHKAKALPKDLSGGEESRVAFARAFIDPPDILLLDEPFRALDAITRFDLQDILLTFAKTTTVILVSHSIDDAVFLGDKVIVLSQKPMCIFKELLITSARPRVHGDSVLVKYSSQVATLLRQARESITSK